MSDRISLTKKCRSPVSGQEATPYLLVPETLACVCTARSSLVEDDVVERTVLRGFTVPTKTDMPHMRHSETANLGGGRVLSWATEAARTRTGARKERDPCRMMEFTV
jgi:hypothetical protein